MEIVLGLFIALVLGMLGLAEGLKIALYALPMFVMVMAANGGVVLVLRYGRSLVQRPGVYLLDLVSGVVTWVLVIWAWGADGVFLTMAQGPETPLNPAWIRRQVQPGSAFGTHLQRDIWWGIHWAIIAPLRVWHRQPLQHLGDLWKATTLWHMTLIWLEYDAVIVVLAGVLVGVWWGLAHLEAGGWRLVGWLVRRPRAVKPAAAASFERASVVIFRERRAKQRREGEGGRT